MRSYLDLVPVSARVHKRQSRMTRICIILAVFLVTSIFSLLEMWMDGQTTAMRSKHGDWHIALQNITDGKAEQIIDASDVKYSSWFDAVNADAQGGGWPFHLLTEDIEFTINNVTLGMKVGSLYAIVVGPTTLKVPQPAMTFADFSIVWFIIGAAAVLTPCVCALTLSLATR